MATDFQEQNPDPRGISIARLISSELGSAELVVRHQLDKRETTIEIDGVPWEGDKRFIPRARLVGRTLVVIGPERQWRLRYPE